MNLAVSKEHCVSVETLEYRSLKELCSVIKFSAPNTPLIANF